MRLLHYALAIVGLLFSACDQANQDSGDSREGGASEASLITKCVACGNDISKQAHECPGCGHPNPMFITAEKRGAEETMKLAEVEEKNRDEVDAKRLKEMERKALAEMEARYIAEEEAKRQDEKAKSLAEEAKGRDGGVAELKARGGPAVAERQRGQSRND